MTKILVIKINEDIKDPEKLRERTEKAWKINPQRLREIEYVIVMKQMEVIAEFELSPKIVTYNLETGRVELQLKPTDNVSELVGKSINYKTANPCTVSTLSDLKEEVI